MPRRDVDAAGRLRRVLRGRNGRHGLQEQPQAPPIRSDRDERGAAVGARARAGAFGALRGCLRPPPTPSTLDLKCRNRL